MDGLRYGRELGVFKFSNHIDVLYNPPMPDAPEPAPIIHIYRPTLRRRIGSEGGLGVGGVFFGLPLSTFLYLAIKPLVNDPQVGLIVAGGLCFLAPLGLLLLLLLVQLVLSVLAMFFGNYLKLTPVGLEYRSWPYRHVRCSWTELKRVGKYYLFYDAIYLKSFEIIGLSLALNKWWKLFNVTVQTPVLLSGMQGWPDGALAANLRQYAPQLFDPQTGKPVITPAQPPASALDQEERLYAALSHAGALLFPVFVPLAFWLAERKKSAYTAFQSLQALVFQVVMLATFIATFICVISGLLIPVGLTQLSEQILIDGRTYGLIVLIAFALGGLLSAAGLLMLLYSGVAITQTYQGVDFRYPLVGKWLEKYQPTNLTGSDKEHR